MKINYIFNSSPSSEQQTTDYTKIHRAIERIVEFATDHHLPIPNPQDLVEDVFIFDNHDTFATRLAQVLQVHKNKILPTFVGTMHHRHLYLMIEPYYLHVSTPADSFEAYEKLVTHELAHQYHVFLLNGDEDKMGPMWFFEGFATTVANQYTEKIASVKRSDIQELMFTEERSSYVVYRAIFDRLVRHKSVSSLLQEASSEDFSKGIFELIKDDFSI